ncbi:MAG TPA: nickel pincer cofactor biosynthesis protein LarC [Planctomycetes bacterium]|nr:nickel pincer cofactor biosynthesis protein LarC [Planctomycetota bacterium]HIL37619.1 nickel pincer cofactor biosynthesis protein LarC [Planctomycetota bacterium]
MTDLFIEPFGGMAGDMFLAALLDLQDERFDLTVLEDLAQDLFPGEVQLTVSEVWRGGLSGRHLRVQTKTDAALPMRCLKDLLGRLDRARLSARVRERAGRVLQLLAEAEGRVHGCSPQEVHFHEVGAVDTLIDVAGAALALERLGIERVLVTPPLVGSGTVTCAHGEMPVPVPAVVELLRGRPTLMGGGRERTTPTGAAILAALCDEFAPPTTFQTERVGYGAGTADPSEQPPNLLRLQLGQAADQSSGASGRRRTEVDLLEVTIDDMTGEDVGHLTGCLRAAGALEVWSAPVFMKKDRPGVVLSALMRTGRRAVLEDVVFRWSTSLGVRWLKVERLECARRNIKVELRGAEVRVKIRQRPGVEAGSTLTIEERDLFPEHDDVAALAEHANLTLRQVRAEVTALALDELALEVVVPIKAGSSS